MMKHKIALLLFITITLQISHAQVVPILSFKEFEHRLHPTNDTVYVINFWATWCKPCVEEMPAFMKLHQTFREQNFKLILTSLDFKSQYEKKLLPFVKENNIDAEVILLNAPQYNDWIPKVSKKWGGSIPATLIIHYPSKTRLFFERQMHYEELEQLIKPLLNLP